MFLASRWARQSADSLRAYRKIFLQYQLIQSQFDLHKIKLKKISKTRLDFFTLVWKATKVLLPALIKVVYVY